jgi:very-short-patch-repair endonuclease
VALLAAPAQPLGPRSKVIKRPGRKIPQLVRPRDKNRKPLTVRGPKPFIKRPEQTDAPGIKPGNFTITQPEWCVYWWLQKRHRQFTFQSSLLGGRQVLGGLVTDFIVHDATAPPGLVINVQGFAWHRHTTVQRQADVTTKVRLEALGFAVVYVLEDEVINALDYVMDLAVNQLKQTFPDSV